MTAVVPEARFTGDCRRWADGGRSNLRDAPCRCLSICGRSLALAILAGALGCAHGGRHSVEPPSWAIRAEVFGVWDFDDPEVPRSIGGGNGPMAIEGGAPDGELTLVFDDGLTCMRVPGVYSHVGGEAVYTAPGYVEVLIRFVGPGRAFVTAFGPPTVTSLARQSRQMKPTEYVGCE